VPLLLSWVPVEYLLFVHTALQRDERVLVVWSDNLDGIVPLCREFESHLIKLVWSHRNSVGGITPGPSIIGTPAETSTVNSAVDVALNEKPQDTESTPEADLEASARPISGGSLWGWRIGARAKRSPGPRDPENTGPGPRPTRYFAPVYSGLGLALSTCKPLSRQLAYLFLTVCWFAALVFMGCAVSVLITESRLSNDYMRFALLATTPFLFCVSLVSPHSTTCLVTLPEFPW
jgi:hypothetical protein